jgi:hypothetical protein
MQMTSNPNFEIFLEKWNNFYKFLQDKKSFKEIVFGDQTIVDPGVTISAMLFISKVRMLRKTHPAVIEKVQQWMEKYYEALNNKSKSPANETFTDMTIELAKAVGSVASDEDLQKLIQKHHDDALLLMRYMDTFFDKEIIPE